METKRVQAKVRVSQTIQVYQYEPYTIDVETVLENSEGVSKDDIATEERNLEVFVGTLIKRKVEVVKN